MLVVVCNTININIESKKNGANGISFISLYINFFIVIYIILITIIIINDSMVVLNPKYKPITEKALISPPIGLFAIIAGIRNIKKANRNP